MHSLKDNTELRAKVWKLILKELMIKDNNINKETVNIPFPKIYVKTAIFFNFFGNFSRE